MFLRSLISTAAALGFAASAFAGGVPTLIYDYQTGGVSVSAEGNTIVSFGLQSAGAFTGNFDATQLDADVFGGALPGLVDNTDSVVGWASGGAAGGAGYSGAVNSPAFVGNILASGLDQAALDATLTDASWAGPAGGASGSFLTTVINVPEPGSLALLGLGGVALLRRRR